MCIIKTFKKNKQKNKHVGQYEWVSVWDSRFQMIAFCHEGAAVPFQPVREKFFKLLYLSHPTKTLATCRDVGFLWKKRAVVLTLLLDIKSFYRRIKDRFLNEQHGDNTRDQTLNNNWHAWQHSNYWAILLFVHNDNTFTIYCDK